MERWAIVQRISVASQVMDKHELLVDVWLQRTNSRLQEAGDDRKSHSSNQPTAQITPRLQRLRVRRVMGKWQQGHCWCCWDDQQSELSWGLWQPDGPERFCPDEEGTALVRSGSGAEQMTTLRGRGMRQRTTAVLQGFSLGERARNIYKESN